MGGERERMSLGSARVVVEEIEGLQDDEAIKRFLK